MGVGDSGSPDFLKILLDAADSVGRDVSSLKRALVSGAAFPKSLQEEVHSHGIDAYQAFRTADLGLIAFETPARDGMVVNEDLIMEIVRPEHDGLPTWAKDNAQAVYQKDASVRMQASCSALSMSASIHLRGIKNHIV
jgi:hypothetical protein